MSLANAKTPGVVQEIKTNIRSTLWRHATDNSCCIGNKGVGVPSMNLSAISFIK